MLDTNRWLSKAQPPILVKLFARQKGWRCNSARLECCAHIGKDSVSNADVGSSKLPTAILFSEKELLFNTVFITLPIKFLIINF